MPYILRERVGHVALLTISRPEALGAINRAMLHEIRETFEGLSKEKDIRAVVLTGEGRAFVAGADIAEMRDFTRGDALAYAQLGAEAFAAIEGLDRPVIAAVNGFALGGGCELALSCDMRLAAETAQFGQPEVGLGITPGFGGTQRLAFAVGTSRAMELIVTGRRIKAAEALSLGLVSAVYPGDTLLQEAMKLGETIAKNGPIAVSAAKKAIRFFQDHALQDGFAEEARRFARCFETEDQREAMGAFVEKKDFKGFCGR